MIRMLFGLAMLGCAAEEAGPGRMKPGHVFAPVDELAEVAAKAMERIERATCVGLSLAPTGSPVTFGAVPDNPDTPEDESGACGLTMVYGYDLSKPTRLVTRTEIVIANPAPYDCPDLETVLLHEFIHELRRDVPVAVGHTAEFGPGVFAAHVGWHPALIEADLLAICELQDCRCFNPEEE